MKTFTTVSQLSQAVLQAGQIVMVTGEITQGGDGQSFYQVHDGAQAGELPANRVSLANGNLAIPTSQKILNAQYVQYTIASSGATEVDLKEGLYQSTTLTQDTTVTIVGAATYSDIVQSFELVVTHDGTGQHIVTWPNNITWASGVPLVVPKEAGKVSVVGFTTYDNGSQWLATVLSGDFVKESDIDNVASPNAVLGIVPWGNDWGEGVGEGTTNNQKLPNLIGREVYMILVDTYNADEIGVAQFFIPEIVGNDFSSGVLFYQDVADHRMLKYRYSDGNLGVGGTNYTHVWSRLPNDLPSPMPIVTWRDTPEP